MLERSLTYFLASISEDGIGKANHIFEVRFGLSVRELRVLRLVRAAPGITFTVLAGMTKFERSLTSRILSKLIQNGLVLREGNLRDARQFTLQATATGEALCAKADPLTQELESLMLSPLSDAERAAFLDMVGRVKTWVQTGYGERVESAHPELGIRKLKRKRSV